MIITNVVKKKYSAYIYSKRLFGRKGKILGFINDIDAESEEAAMLFAESILENEHNEIEPYIIEIREQKALK